MLSLSFRIFPHDIRHLHKILFCAATRFLDSVFQNRFNLSDIIPISSGLFSQSKKLDPVIGSGLIDFQTYFIASVNLIEFYILLGANR